MSATEAGREPSPNHLANLTFDGDGPEFENSLGYREHWMARADLHWCAVRLAAGLLRKNDAEMCSVVPTIGVETMRTIVDDIRRVRIHYSTLGSILQRAETRVQAGLCRHLANAEAAA